MQNIALLFDHLIKIGNNDFSNHDQGKVITKCCPAIRIHMRLNQLTLMRRKKETIIRVEKPK